MSAEAEVLDEIEFPLGDYRVLQLLGRGGIGEVFIAQRRGTTDLCALKRLRPDVMAMEAARARIRREAHLATYLDHPNLCRVLDAGNEAGSFFLACEFVCGVDLERLIQALAERRLALSMDMVMAIMLQTLAGLTHAHNARGPQGNLLGVIHRDLTPRNIMVTFEGKVKIIDFGIARADVDNYKTKPGVLLGTLKYLSPEQALGNPIDARSDLYSLGALMYEMLTGRSVVTGNQNLMEALHQIIGEEPPPVTQFNPAVPEAVSRVLGRALAKDRDHRYRSASEMSQALLQYAGPAAAPEALGELVRALFPDVERRMSAAYERARENATPLPRDPSTVDPFSATAVAAAPSEAYLPTRAGQLAEPEDEPTRTVVLTQIEHLETQAQAVFPTRILPEAGLKPQFMPTVGYAPTQLAPPPSSSSHSSPAPRRTRTLALALMVVAVVAGAAVVTMKLVAKPEPLPGRIVAAPEPAIAPRPEVTAQPQAAAGVVVVAPQPRPDPKPVVRVKSIVRRPAPKPVKVKTDALQVELSKMRRAMDRGEPLDPAALNTLLERVSVRAKAAGTQDAGRLVRRAKDCLAACPTQDKMLSRVAQALTAVLSAERS